MSRRLTTLLTAALLGLTAALGSAGPAAAVPADKPAVLSGWTQTSASSYSAWNSARLNQGAWAAYQFDWSTDYCSSSPDNPLGFDFRLSCHRHDFGYRNYKAIGQFSANKARVDSAFYEDLKRACARYSSFVRPACLSLTWTYYQAVRIFGAPVVTAADLDRARQLRAAGPRLAGTD
ncbi:phospholipase [Micromonospora sp. LOL_015]|uniref:phospholipase n=1 Tax=Micromonospora sp. LOL_015 TaxID=3345416 RepID=UPI003A8A1CFC